ncbi:DUF6455 family protein [Halodurantibacterium flavum]|uniref:DUF6455 family protein n=1 Tax=Halodurantibacterium flavum TaxID=1382802 RepID=A0ABW4S2X2_9RHOB
MIGLTRLDRHATLVGRMAETTGIDMADALVTGRLSGPSLRGAVLRCCGCDKAEACQGWLDAQERGRQERQAGAAPATAPDYCRNRDLMARLRP